MKQLLLLLILSLCAAAGEAQIKAGDTARRMAMPVMVVKNSRHILPPAKALLVKTDVARLKQQLKDMSDSVMATKQEVDVLLAGMEKSDNLSNMGELESLRVQMAMDRLSKAMSTLSNILKKISDTQGQIVQNLK
jgi:hypothetical protein